MTKRRKKPVIMIGKLESNYRSYLKSDGQGEWLMFFCRGPSWGCKRTPSQFKLCKQPCNNCVGVTKGETVEQVVRRIQQEIQGGKQT